MQSISVLLDFSKASYSKDPSFTCTFRAFSPRFILFIWSMIVFRWTLLFFNHSWILLVMWLLSISRIYFFHGLTHIILKKPLFPEIWTITVSCYIYINRNGPLNLLGVVLYMRTLFLMFDRLIQSISLWFLARGVIQSIVDSFGCFCSLKFKYFWLYGLLYLGFCWPWSMLCGSRHRYKYEDH